MSNKKPSLETLSPKPHTPKDPPNPKAQSPKLSSSLSQGDTFLTCLGLGAIAISVLQWCFCHKPPPPMEKPLL